MSRRLLAAIAAFFPFTAAALALATLKIHGHGFVGLGFERSILLSIRDALTATVPPGLAAGLVASLILAPLARRATDLPSGRSRTLVLVASSLILSLLLARLFWSARRSGLYQLGAYQLGELVATILLAGLFSTPLIAFPMLTRWSRARLFAGGACLTALAAWPVAATAIAIFPTTAPAHAPNVLLVSLDTLRADRVTVFGYHRPTTPNLTRLAASGTAFDTAITTAPWTLPSHASMLTGSYPHHHGATEPRALLATGNLSLAEYLRELGYSTAAVTGGGHLSARFGLDQGFDNYVSTDHESTAETVSLALDWLENAPRPFFLFLHTYEPHMPYEDQTFVRPEDADSVGPSFDREDLMRLREEGWEPTPREQRYISDLYDGDALSTDTALGRLLIWLERGKELDGTVVIVTSDHGEELFDRGKTHSVRHGHTLYEELIHIPLIIRYPPAFPPGSRITEPTSLVDLVPTVAELVGVPWPVSSDGLDLSALTRDDAAFSRRGVLSEALGSGPQKRSLRRARYKLIMPIEQSSSLPELFDLQEDPSESHDIFSSSTEIAAAMVRELLAFDPLQGTSGKVGLTPELEEQLRTLGYIN